MCGTDQSQYPDELEDDSEVEHDGNGSASTLCSVWSVTGKHSHQQHHLHHNTNLYSSQNVLTQCILLF